MTKYPYKETGNLIREVRTSIQGLTQKKLASDVGVSENYIAMLERGSKPLTAGMAYKIGRVCSVHPDYLLHLSEQSNVGRPLNFEYEHEKSIMFNMFIDFISRKAGYTIERINSDIPEELQSRIVCKFIINDSSVAVSSRAIQEYFEDIAEYAEFRLNKMIEKEEEENG